MCIPSAAAKILKESRRCCCAVLRRSCMQCLPRFHLIISVHVLILPSFDGALEPHRQYLQFHNPHRPALIQYGPGSTTTVSVMPEAVLQPQAQLAWLISLGSMSSHVLFGPGCLFCLNFCLCLFRLLSVTFLLFKRGLCEIQRSGIYPLLRDHENDIN